MRLGDFILLIYPEGATIYLYSDNKFIMKCNSDSIALPYFADSMVKNFGVDCFDGVPVLLVFLTAVKPS